MLGLIYDNDGKLIRNDGPRRRRAETSGQTPSRPSGSRKPEDLHAEIREGHPSSASCELVLHRPHLGSAVPRRRKKSASRSRTCPGAEETVASPIEHVRQTRFPRRRTDYPRDPGSKVDREAERITGTPTPRPPTPSCAGRKTADLSWCRRSTRAGSKGRENVAFLLYVFGIFTGHQPDDPRMRPLFSAHEFVNDARDQCLIGDTLDCSFDAKSDPVH